jgi:Holliday junction resolvase RusA-like endonuclease
VILSFCAHQPGYSLGGRKPRNVTPGPKPQGSHAVVPLRKGKQIVGHTVIEAAELKRWRKKLAGIASAAAARSHWEVPEGAVIVQAIFIFPWPKGMTKAKRKSLAGVVKSTAPDTDKLQRAIGDSLESAGVIRNDSQIAAWWMPCKIYGDAPGVIVRVWTATPEDVAVALLPPMELRAAVQAHQEEVDQARIEALRSHSAGLLDRPL